MVLEPRDLHHLAVVGRFWPARQREGCLDSLLHLRGLDLKAPDHTTLSSRNPIAAVSSRARVHNGAIHLTVDSARLKILGSGEWSAHNPHESVCLR